MILCLTSHPLVGSVCSPFYLILHTMFTKGIFYFHFYRILPSTPYTLVGLVCIIIFYFYSSETRIFGNPV
ncbi:hypothetical protein RIF29_17365 [Crotalaria pallida]|uniref:Uncharacterized protein n=1 Tax=Crotalaria pallida TaxID=3830 RepID=A0AAN9FQI2_CROPI